MQAGRIPSTPFREFLLLIIGVLINAIIESLLLPLGSFGYRACHGYVPYAYFPPSTPFREFLPCSIPQPHPHMR